MKEHHYTVDLEWTGNRGDGTLSYQSYGRDYQISASDKASGIAGSSDASFRGDKTRYNPEELLVSSLSSCHMLWYLHLCAVNKVVVISYSDQAEGTMVETNDGGGHFKEVILYPQVIVEDGSMIDKARELHQEAHKLCFIANSCNFPVRHQPHIEAKEE
jgi:organic hydroperoxide reductase OsmC/OhrA